MGCVCASSMSAIDLDGWVIAARCWTSWVRCENRNYSSRLCRWRRDHKSETAFHLSAPLLALTLEPAHHETDNASFRHHATRGVDPRWSGLQQKLSFPRPCQWTRYHSEQCMCTTTGKQRVSTPSGVKMALNPGNHMMRVYFRAARLATLRCAFTVID